MKHLLAAIAATLLVYIVMERATATLLPVVAALVGAGNTAWAMIAFAGLTCFVAYMAGASISRGPFLLPALALWLVFGIRFLNAGYRMQIAATPSAVDRYFVQSLPLICATLVGTLLGVIVGSYLAQVADVGGELSHGSPLRSAASFQRRMNTPSNNDEPRPATRGLLPCDGRHGRIHRSHCHVTFYSHAT